MIFHSLMVDVNFLSGHLAKRIDIVVSHIKTPGDFWVQRIKDLEEIKRLSRNISSWVINPGIHSQSTSQVFIKGELFIGEVNT